MKTTPFITSLALVHLSLAQMRGDGPEPTTIIDRYPTPTPEVSNCDANLITTLCDYKDPGPSFAVASSGKKHCWEYCNAHPPCNFVIFAAGNPYTGSGSCWLYPGEQFDESAGEKGNCGNEYLSVFDKPACAGEPTPTEGACAATASPSAIAEICDYPEPETCFKTCSAQSGAVGCLSQCTELESCSYAVFVPRNYDGSPGESPYMSGTCWMYPEGSYDASKAGKCSGKPEQYVYENPCPKPKPSASPSAPKDKGEGEGKGDATESGDAAKPSASVEQGFEAYVEPLETEGAASSSGFSVGALFVAGISALFY